MQDFEDQLTRRLILLVFDKLNKDGLSNTVKHNG
jgi:hypothetical protein